MSTAAEPGTTITELLILIDALLRTGAVTGATPVAVSEDEPLAARLDPAGHRPRRLGGYQVHTGDAGVQLVLHTA